MAKVRVFLIVLMIAAGGAAYYYWVYRSAQEVVQEVAYVLPSSVLVVDSRAEIHLVVGILKNGDAVKVLSREDDWARVRMGSGQIGWIESRYLTNAQDYEEGQRLLKDLEGIPLQAAGHTTAEVNLRLEPSLEAPILARLQRNQKVEIYGRRVIEATPSSTETAETGITSAGPENAATRSSRPDVWYPVRTEGRAGWISGRLVAFDIPEEISVYAQDRNVVAWVVLNRVEDNGRNVPQYLVADRSGSPEFDFDRIRVFTWWAAEGHYSTAYVESRLQGYFPIRVSQVEDIPYFRLRLVSKDGQKFQKVYRLMQTIVRPVGTVDGWVSDALPEVSTEARRNRPR